MYLSSPSPLTNISFSPHACAHACNPFLIQGDKLIHTFDIFLVDTDNNVKLVYVGTSSGNTEGMQIFSLKDRAAEAVAIAIVGYGTDETG